MKRTKQTKKEVPWPQIIDDELFHKIIDEAVIPDGYDVSPKGISWFNEDGERNIVSRQPLVAGGYIRDNQQEQWFTILRWIDLDGKFREKIFPNRMLDEGNELIKILSDHGYKVNIEARKEFRKYLSDLRPRKRLRLAKKLGWQETTDGNQVYVLKNEIIGKSSGEPYYFLPDQYSTTADNIEKSGTFNDWKNSVAQAASGNPIMIFCLCVAFAGPLMKFVGAESGGFHIWGGSSKGKTTCVQVAATVWGNGISPNVSSSKTFIGTWKTTANALEGIAAAHNDGLLILDEIGQCDVLNFQRVVYDIAAGQGKVRMNQDATLSRIRTWLIIYLSTGEISAKAKMESGGIYNNKDKAKAGQLLRLMDIPISEGIVQNSHGKTSRDFVDTLQRNCATHYGWGGPKYVQGLLDNYDVTSLVESMRQYKEYFLEKLNVSETDQQRAVTRLAFIAMAGHLACELDILPLTLEEVENAILYVTKLWLKDTPHLNDAARAVIYIRDFISKHKSKFQLCLNDSPPSNMAGYRIENKNVPLYLFNDTSFIEACQGVPVDAVCHELKKRNLLHQNNPGKNKARFLLNKELAKQPFYAVKASILELAFDENDNLLQTGTDNS